MSKLSKRRRKNLSPLRPVQGNGLISPRRYREKGSILGQKIENSWFSPKNTGDL